MSSTTRPKRTGPDAYFTPDPVARACVATLGNLRGLTVWEPHAGGGAYVRALSDAYATVYASDIDPRHGGAWRGAAIRDVGDFLTMDVPGRPEWVVGNPPFSQAERHIRRGLDVASVGVGFLLRLAMLESAERRKLWAETPLAEVHVCVDRVGYLEDYGGGAIGPLRKRDKRTGEVVMQRRDPTKPMLAGVDSSAYAWFVWRRGYVGRPGLYWLEV